MTSSAVFSPCRTYRYTLSRIWDPERPRAVFIGLNPSTADETFDDPTVRRCCRFARSWGFGGVIIVNLFAFRATNPGDLANVLDPLGPENDEWIMRSTAGSNEIIACWGALGGLNGRYEDVIALINMPLQCLGVTKHGHPRHLLYVRGDTQPLPFSCYHLPKR